MDHALHHRSPLWPLILPIIVLIVINQTAVRFPAEKAPTVATVCWPSPMEKRLVNYPR